MRRLYFKLLIISGGLTLVLGIKDLSVAILMLTLGLAFPLLFSPTLFLYLLCLFPAVYLWNTRLKAKASLVSLALIFLAGFAPPLLSQMEQRKVETDLAELSRVPSGKFAARTLELLKPASFNANIIRGFENEACDRVCHSLIENNEVDWVRVKSAVPADRKRPNAFDVTLFTTGSGSDCNVPGGSAQVPSHCVLVRPNNDATAGLTIRLEDGYGDGRAAPDDQRQPNMRGWRRISAYVGAPEQPVLRLQEQNYERIWMPSIVGPSFSGMASSGFEFWREGIRLNPLEYEAAYRMLGYKVVMPAEKIAAKETETWRREPSDAEIRGVTSVLDLPGDAKFNAAQMELVNNWITYARIYKEWTTERIGLAKRVMLDRRMGFAVFFDQVFSKPDVSRELMPIVLDNLEAHGEDGITEAQQQALWTFRFLDPALLQPHAEQILRMVEQKKFGKFARSFFSALSLVGKDPTPFFPMLIGEDADEIRIQALCLAVPTGKAAYISQLRQLLAASITSNEEWPDDKVKSALTALVVHGDEAFAQSVIDASIWRNKGKMLGNMVRTRDRKDATRYSKCD